MNNELQSLEQWVFNNYQQVLIPLAKRYHYDLPPYPKAAGGKPSVVLLGNHSSGKSTFINTLLGEQLQKTGVAPTDDGFTIITKGETDEESRGPGAVHRAQFPFDGMDRLGPGFLSRLRVRTRCQPDILNEVNLIDSPGMIDTADTAADREYDFMAAVRYFAENCDLVLFFFDPEKPGTTGETVSVFTEALAGMEHKMLIILNKVDLFLNIRDFARDYGALCWNLAKVIRTKDLPHIFTMYVPTDHTSEDAPGIPLADFDECREEVSNEIRTAASRRADNLIGNLHEQTARLSMYVRVCREFQRMLFTASLQHTIPVLLILIATGLGAYVLREMTALPDMQLMLIVAGGVIVSLIIWLIGHFMQKRFYSTLLEGLDAIFERLYKQEMTVSNRYDLRARWEVIKPSVYKVLKNLGPKALPSFSLTWNRRCNQLQKLLTKGITSKRAGFSPKG